MRILILGAGGMLGHKLAGLLSERHDVVATVRDAAPPVELAVRLPRVTLRGGLDAVAPDAVAALLRQERPDAVVNCIGIIKQLKAAKDALPSIAINALFPHQLADWCGGIGSRLVHFGTDCVFSGAAGPYRPDAPADAPDLYGRTKYLGEVSGEGCLTIRSSIVGHELKGHVSLVDWFLSQAGGRVKGFANALYTGMPTVVMAEVVRLALEEWTDLEGVWQVAADPIAKYDLLHLINHIYGLGTRIDRDEAFHCDRRLDGTAFRERTGWEAPPWPAMVASMHADYLASGGGNARQNG